MALKIGYLVEWNKGDYGRPRPSREEIADALQYWINMAVTCEEAGFDGIFIPDRHMRPESFAGSQFVLMSAIAARTSSIKIGSFCTVTTLYNPIELAETLAAIDNLSRGRLIFTPAMGYHDDYWRFFGINGRHRVSRFEEGMEVILKAWTEEEPWSYHGKRFQYENIVLHPRPYQRPRPEIWMGGQLERAIRRAGRWGEAYAMDPFPLEKETWTAQVKLYRDSCKEYGNTGGGKIVMMRDGFCAPTRKEADERFGTYYVDEMLFYLRWGILGHHPDFQREEQFTMDNMRKHVIVGDPDDCIKALEMFRDELYADYIVLRCRVPRAPSFEDEINSIRMFGREVLPYFKKLEQQAQAALQGV